MIITIQFYRISNPQPQSIPPPPDCLLWRAKVFQSLWVSIYSAKKGTPVFHLNVFKNSR